VGEGFRGRDKVVDLNIDLLVGEKGSEPRTEVGIKFKEGGEMEEPFNINVVKEALDVKEKERADDFGVNGGLSHVGHC
jgi:hypothetical protein